MTDTNSIHPEAAPRYIRAQRLAWREIAEETVVIDLGRHKAHSLNGTGSVLWHQLEHPRTVDELVTSLENGAHSLETVRCEVTGFIEELSRFGLVQVVDNEVSTPAAGSSSSRSPYVPPHIAWTEAMSTCVLQGSCAHSPGLTPCESAPGGAFGS